MNPRSVTEILRVLEATEANVLKLERLWSKIQDVIPQDVVFGNNAVYDDLRRQFAELVKYLPAIDGWRLEDRTAELNEIAQWRYDAREIGEIEAAMATEDAIEQPGRDIAEYRFRFNRKRRTLLRASVTAATEQFESVINSLAPLIQGEYEPMKKIPADAIEVLRNTITQVDTLLGSSVVRPPGWTDLQRHLHFGQLADLHDITYTDWPTIKPALVSALYGEEEAIPVPVDDLGELTAAPVGSVVPIGLAWSTLSAEAFERLLFALLSSDPSYENPKWLMHTNASDRGRDLSAVRVTRDSLSGTRSERVIVQCKHWLNKSISVSDVSILKDQMSHWGPPRVDILIIATSGRFSADAVQWIESHNQSNSALRIETLAGSHLELLLAGKPGLIAEFGLRG
ncbi:MAG TPA: restriction endonuclease [Longimicrobium sp.]|jgi:hypothetical protein